MDFQQGIKYTPQSIRQDVGLIRKLGMIDMARLSSQNELDRLYWCHQCAHEVPVYTRTITSVDRFIGLTIETQIHCLKCQTKGSRDTYIKDL